MADNVVPIRREKGEPDRSLIREDLGVADGMVTEALANAREGDDDRLTTSIVRASDAVKYARAIAEQEG